MRPYHPNPEPDTPSDDPDDELSIDLLNDSFFLEGMARIMAEARARGQGRAGLAAQPDELSRR